MKCCEKLIDSVNAQLIVGTQFDMNILTQEQCQ